MKKIKHVLFVSLLLIFGTTEINAQYKFFTGGAVGFAQSSNNQNDGKESVAMFSPYIGYCVNDNIIIGLALNYETYKDETASDDFYKSTDLGFTPFVRYRVAKGAVGVYMEAGASYLTNSSESQGPFGNSENSGKTIRGYVGPGIDYAFNDRWVVNAQWGALQYQKTSDDDSDFSRSTFGVVLDMTAMNFGLNYMFGGGSSDE